MMPLGQLKKGILNPKRYPMAFEHRKWVTANKKCLAVIKNMIEPAIMGSILECDTVTEYLDRIKSSSLTLQRYATQLIKLVTECYSGNGGIRELTMRCRNYGTVVQAIFRGGEQKKQVKNGIIPPLELSDLEQCRECIKRKVCKEN